MYEFHLKGRVEEESFDSIRQNAITNEDNQGDSHEQQPKEEGLHYIVIACRTHILRQEGKPKES